MTEFDKVQDSGQRQEFETGSVRDTREGKPRFDLIPPYPLARLAKHYSNGSVKYGDWNWTKGQPLMRYFDSCLRHINKYLDGSRDEDHLAAAAWNLFSIIHTEEMIRRGMLPAELDDMPRWHPPENIPPRLPTAGCVIPPPANSTASFGDLVGDEAEHIRQRWGRLDESCRGK